MSHAHVMLFDGPWQDKSVIRLVADYQVAFENALAASWLHGSVRDLGCRDVCKFHCRAI